MAKRTAKTQRPGMPPDIPRYNAQEQYAWVEFRNTDAEEGAPALWARVRTELRIKEADSLVLTQETMMTEAWEMVAPYVTGWNVDDQDGAAVPPPAEAGGQQFNWISNKQFWKIYLYLRKGSEGTVEAKPWTPSMPTDGSDGVTSSNAAILSVKGNGTSDPGS